MVELVGDLVNEFSATEPIVQDGCITVWEYIYKADRSRISYPSKGRLTMDEVAAKGSEIRWVINDILEFRHVVITAKTSLRPD